MERPHNVVPICFGDDRRCGYRGNTRVGAYEAAHAGGPISGRGRSYAPIHDIVIGDDGGDELAERLAVGPADATGVDLIYLDQSRLGDERVRVDERC